MNKIVPIIMVVLMFIACSHKHSNPSYSKINDLKGLKSTRAMVHKAEVELVVKIPDSIPQMILAMVDLENGQLISQNTNSEIWNEIKIAVPAPQLNSTLFKISKLGKCISKEITSVDGTEEYENIQIRLESSKSARKRFTELLDLSPDIATIIQIEKELQRLTYEIESHEAKLKKMDQEINFSEITIRYRKKQKPGIVGYVFVGLYKSVVWLFIRDY